jgi:hypothetical protein
MVYDSATLVRVGLGLGSGLGLGLGLGLASVVYDSATP